MRGADSYNKNLFTTVRLEDFVPSNHPLRPIRHWVNDALAKMDAKFSAMYEADVKGGRPSIAPEQAHAGDVAAGAVLGADFGRQVKAMFDKDLAASQAITLEAWQRRGLDLRFKELFSRAWEYWH